jgi:hypothetical protein
MLYGLGSSNRIYIIDPVTGIARAVTDTPFTPALDGNKFGFDFNPTVDRIRVVSDKGQNLRLHPDTGQVVATDGGLAYEDGEAPAVVAAAYTNSLADAASTTLGGATCQFYEIHLSTGDYLPLGVLGIFEKVSGVAVMPER